MEKNKQEESQNNRFYLRQFCRNAVRISDEQGRKSSWLEKNTGLSRSYLSRVQDDNPDKKYNLNAGSLVRIANALGTSMDYLLLNSDNVTAEERMISDFLRNVTEQAMDNKLSWNAFTEEDEKQADGDFMEFGPIVKVIQFVGPDDFGYYPKHIQKDIANEYDECFSLRLPVPWYGGWSLGPGKAIGGTIYTQINMLLPFYWAKLEKIDSKIYLYKVDYLDEPGEHKLSGITECYLETEENKRKKAHFVGSSADKNEYIASAIRGLFDIARDQSSGRRLNDETRDLLSRFNS